MNTIQKLLASAAVNAIPSILDSDESLNSFGVFIALSIISGLPVATDKHINQNITSNKAIQYGLTAAEVVGEFCLFSGLTDSNDFYKGVNECFEDLLSTDFNGVKQSIIAVSALSFIHKYIWDQPNDTNVELDQNSDIAADIDGIKMVALPQTFDSL
jgi:hypothetical protein